MSDYEVRNKPFPVKVLLLLRHFKVKKYLKNHPIYMLDSLGHKFHFPRFIQNHLCETMDWWIGVYDEEDLTTPTE